MYEAVETASTMEGDVVADAQSVDTGGLDGGDTSAEGRGVVNEKFMRHRNADRDWWSHVSVSPSGYRV